ncbi:hypothetical protein QO206_12370 [Leeuwenhoekiella aequorea]|uniref:hypothetical protein n=1 Tax=Leeuwenhoekiella aequorea TaxID=283736 RepID=UPI00352FD6D0|tara:strand:+ start:940 stop:1482 length:543 start_codon:yes stop_codon:yes gene_type:complete
MKTKATLGALLLVVTMTHAQTYTDNAEVTNGSEILEEIELSPQVLANLGIGSVVNPRNATLQGNSVFLTQIGDYNVASVTVFAKASEISLTQRGDENFAGLDYDVKTVISDIKQEGNRNTVYDIVKNKNADISLELEQNGNDLNFQRLGSNSLTQSLQFKQTEASPSLVIRSSTYGTIDN